jgi:hypothetical protein
MEGIQAQLAARSHAPPAPQGAAAAYLNLGGYRLRPDVELHPSAPPPVRVCPRCVSAVLTGDAQSDAPRGAASYQLPPVAQAQAQAPSAKPSSSNWCPARAVRALWCRLSQRPRRACPACTFSNNPTAVVCAMCDTEVRVTLTRRICSFAYF